MSDKSLLHDPVVRQRRIELLALLGTICACIPGRESSTVDQDIGMAAEYLESAEQYVDK